MLRRSARARDALRTTKPMVEGVWRGDVEETPRIRAKHEAHARHFRDIVTACGRSAFKAEHGHAKRQISQPLSQRWSDGLFLNE